MTINRKLAQTQMRLEKERLDHEMEISELRFHTMEKEFQLKTEIAVSNARTLAIDRHDERSGSSIQLSYQPPLLFDHQSPGPVNRQPLGVVENRTSPVAPVYEHATTHVTFRPPQSNRHPLDNPINHSTPLNPQATPFSHIDQPTLSGVHEILKTLVHDLPVKEPEVFSGDRLKFVEWIRSFEALVESRRSDQGDRLYYLGRYTDGEAHDCIQGFLSLKSAQAYNEAMMTITDRYGNRYQLYLEYRRKLNEWPTIKANDGVGLRKFCDFLLCCQSAMASVSYLRVLDDAEENHKILAKLPRYLVDKWSRIVDTWLYDNDDNSCYPPFLTFCQFLMKESRIACGPIKLQVIKDDHPKDEPSSREKKTRRNIGARTFTSGASEVKPDSSWTQPTGPRSPSTNCVACKGPHKLEKCFTFLKLTLHEKTALIKSNALCFGCLNYGHIKVNCHNKNTCDKCGLRHPTLLHDNNYQLRQNNAGNAIPLKSVNNVANDNVNVSSRNAHVISHCLHSDNHVDDDCFHSMIVPVEIYHDCDPNVKICVYALIDEQSNACFVTNQTLNRLKTAGTPVELRLSTVLGEDVIACTKTSGLAVRGLHESCVIQLPACYSRDTIPAKTSQIPKPDTVRKWSHLQGVADQLTEYDDTMEIGLLVGINCVRATKPRSVVSGKDDEPYAIKTALGWGVVGVICQHDDNSSRSHFVYRTQVKEISPAMVSDMINSGFDFKDTGEKMSIQDRRFLNIAKEGIHHRDDKHFELPLPLKMTSTCQTTGTWL